MSINHQIARSTHSLFRELPYFGQNIILVHGQYKNCINYLLSLPTKKYLEKLTGIYDLDLFRLNAAEAVNPGIDSLYYNRIQSRYYCLHSFNKFKSELPSRASESSRYAQEFLLSLQSFSFIQTIDKPSRVHNRSATFTYWRPNLEEFYV